MGKVDAQIRDTYSHIMGNIIRYFERKILDKNFKKSGWYWTHARK